MLDNFSLLRARLRDPHQLQQLARLEAWTRRSLSRLEPVIESRRRSGRVRECHGDLHARNIVWWEDRWLPFDCLEFDPGLRWIDLMSDAAYLYMDLVSRSREDLASNFLSRYLEASGDYEGLRLLHLYCSYRALVRAKVDALWADTADPRERGDLGAPAQRDSALAALARRPGLTERDRLTVEARRGFRYGDPDRHFEVIRQLYRGWPSYWHVWYLRMSVDTTGPRPPWTPTGRTRPARRCRRRFRTTLGGSSPSTTWAGIRSSFSWRQHCATPPPQAWADVMGPQESQAALWQDFAIQGYAGLGQVDSVRRVVAELGKRSRRGWPWLSSEQTEDLGLYRALELMTHGHAAEGESVPRR